jgi:hypothetical protein
MKPLRTFHVLATGSLPGQASELFACAQFQVLAGTSPATIRRISENRCRKVITRNTSLIQNLHNFYVIEAGSSPESIVYQHPG